ncbi:MAG: MazG family protein [Opitutaceae bacterium]|nr:MazG family protein [Opitutaceae bacterium]NBR59795.1 MazG family protein [Opitutaceae bacterium]
MSAIEDLCQTMVRLRAPDGCPWDREQTHQTLARCLIDEVSELLETIDRHDLPHMREELGDVLVQVVFHAQLAAERGDFNFEDVARDINAKLVRRHPHVFGSGQADNSAQVIEVWEKVKAQEKAAAGKTQSTLFKHLPPQLPALMFAENVWKQIDKAKLPTAGVIDADQIAALGPQLDQATLGRMLFELTAAARVTGLDPEGALRQETTRIMQALEHPATPQPINR